MKKIHLICNSHLDPVWLWRWQDGTGSILRMYEINGEDSAANIRLFDKTIRVHIPHNGLVTVDENANTLDAMEWEK